MENWSLKSFRPSTQPLTIPSLPSPSHGDLKSRNQNAAKHQCESASPDECLVLKGAQWLERQHSPFGAQPAAHQTFLQGERKPM